MVPIPRGNWKETVLPRAQAIRDELVARGVRVMLDDRDTQTPGWKFNEWELRGVPLRLEIGPKDLEKSQVVLARRDTREKSFVPMEGLAAHVEQLLAWADRHRADPAICLFHKGKGWQAELTEAMKDWDIECQPLTSVTDRDAVILRIGSYTSAGIRDRQPEGRRREDHDRD